MSAPPPAPPRALPLEGSVFDGLDWDAPPVPVRMLVELPFRLMCEDATYDVDVEGCTIPIQVLGHLVETDAGGSIVSIHDATASESSASWAVVQKSSVAVEVRAMRTTFAFGTAATSGTIRGLRNSCRETLNAHRFARALLDGHVEHINRLRSEE